MPTKRGSRSSRSSHSSRSSRKSRAHRRRRVGGSHYATAVDNDERYHVIDRLKKEGLIGDENIIMDTVKGVIAKPVTFKEYLDMDMGMGITFKLDDKPLSIRSIGSNLYELYDDVGRLLGQFYIR